MTAKETIDIISDSSMGEILSIQKRLEVIVYVMKIVGRKADPMYDDVTDIVGEIYAG